MLEFDNQELAASQAVMEDTFSPEYLTSLYNKMVANSGEPPELRVSVLAPVAVLDILTNFGR
jgi:hypothetical protein